MGVMVEMVAEVEVMEGGSGRGEEGALEEGEGKEKEEEEERRADILLNRPCSYHCCRSGCNQCRHKETLSHQGR